jgi:hypothetical protein
VNGRADVCSNDCKRKPKRLARFFPLRQRQQRRLTLHTVAGKVSLAVAYGRDPQSGKWRGPAREQWGLGPHQKMPPELEDRVCLTATLTGSYEAAAQLSAKWGSGAMESFCSPLQGRFKRCGPFWSPPGLADLLASERARRNLDWDALWSKN